MYLQPAWQTLGYSGHTVSFVLLAAAGAVVPVLARRQVFLRLASAAVVDGGEGGAA